jgi:hypothetical protein
MFGILLIPHSCSIYSSELGLLSEASISDFIKADADSRSEANTTIRLMKVPDCCYCRDPNLY